LGLLSQCCSSLVYHGCAAMAYTVRVSIIATLKGGQANLGVLERVDDAAFADVQKPSRPTAMFGPYAWRRRRCAGAYRRGPHTGATPRSGRR